MDDIKNLILCKIVLFYRKFWISEENSPRQWSAAVLARMSELQGQSHCKLVSPAYCSQTSNQLRVGVHGSQGRQAEL